MEGLGVNKRMPMNRSSKNNSKMMKMTMKKKTKTKKKRSMMSMSLLMSGIFKYLKSDSYFYSPIISPLPFHSSFEFVSSPPGLEASKPVLQDEGKLKEKLVKYLKSDTYLYAPMGVGQAPEFATKTVISSSKGQELLIRTVTSTILSRKIAWQTEHRAEDTASEKRGDYCTNGATRDASLGNPQTPGLKEVKKPVVRRSYRLSTSSENEVLSR